MTEWRRLSVEYQLSVFPDCAELAALHAAAFGYTPEDADAGQWERVLSRSLCWVTAHGGPALVGFVNVAWDGGQHAFLLDTAVHPGYVRQGIGSGLEHLS